jgi:hypothetical protein
MLAESRIPIDANIASWLAAYEILCAVPWLLGAELLHDLQRFRHVLVGREAVVLR